jgi:predicted outer membrane protein
LSPSVGFSAVRLIGLIIVAGLLALVSGCGGSSGSSSSKGAGGTNTGSSAGKQPGSSSLPPRAGTLPAGDIGYLTVEDHRAQVETTAAGVARARASSPAVKALVDRISRDRSGVRAEDAMAAKKQRARLAHTRLTAAEQNEIRVLVPLSGRPFDTAYLKLESRFTSEAIAAASAEVRTARSAAVRSLASKHLGVFTADLRALRSAAP